jgi:predicted signal transduction protein with EAL and GGDEF domain
MTSTMMRSLATEQGARCCRQWVVDDLGCDAAQGYLMGRPVPAEDFDLGPVATKALHRPATGARVLPRLTPPVAA